MDLREIGAHGAAVLVTAGWGGLWFSGRVPGSTWVTVGIWILAGLAAVLAVMGGWRGQATWLGASAWLFWLVSFPLILGGVGLVTVMLATLVVFYLRARCRGRDQVPLSTRALGTAAAAGAAWIVYSAGRTLFEQGDLGQTIVSGFMLAILSLLALAAWSPLSGSHRPGTS